MKKDEFTKDLPVVVECEKCSRKVPCPGWHVGPYELCEWMAICAVKCDPCDWMMVAVAGSSDAAYRKARIMRSHLVAALIAKTKPKNAASKTV